MVRPPSTISLTELFLLNLLGSQQVQADGSVRESDRLEAERTYLSTQREEPSRPLPTPRRRRRPITAPPRVPPPSSFSHVESSSHVARIRLRSTLEERVAEPPPPTSLVLDVCCVCLGRKRTHAFSPCFHMCACSTCADRLDACPICRTKAQAVHRIFF